MDKRTLKIGILGCADIADRYIIPNILNLPDEYELIGIASRTQEKAQEFASKFNTVPYSSYNRLLDNSELEAVYIPLPNSLHAEWINECLQRGLHVIVEKSMATDYVTVNNLNSAAIAKSLVLFENFQFRFHSQLQWIQNQVRDGVIGELRCIKSSFGFPPFKDENNIRYNKELGGGALLDTGAYPIKISQIFLGEDVSVNSAKLHLDERTGVDIWGGGFVSQNKGDLFSEIAFGFDNYYQCSLELWGNKGKLFTNRIFTAPPGYKPEITLDRDGQSEKITLPEDNHFINMLRHFHQLVTSGNQYENIQNIKQAELIDEFRRKSY